MEVPSFTPQRAIATDTISEKLFMVSRGIVLVVVGLLPVLFIPGLLDIATPVKTFAVLFAIVAAVIVGSLGLLRAGVLSVRPLPLLVSWWGVVLAATVAGLMAPQMRVAFLGDALEIHTVGFLAIMGALMSLMLLFKKAKAGIMYFYGLLFISAALLSLYHILRIVFGPDTLAFGILTNPAATIVGSFNDLGLVLALTIMVGLITLVQLPVQRPLSYVLVASIGLSLMMLAVINFFMVWVFLGLFSLLLVMYSLTKGRMGGRAAALPTDGPSLTVTILSLVVFVVSTVFVIGGASLGAWVSNQTGVSYLEVRPSVSATADIVRQTFGDNAFVGSGPNHFAESWVQYRERAINETVFWNVPFSAGSGYIPTWFVTTGLLGVLAWLVFIGLFFWTGIQTLLRNTADDRFWYFIATISYAVSFFVLVMSFLYVPGPVVLLVGAATLGLFLVASEQLSTRTVPTFNFLTSARTGFILITAVMVIIIGSIAVGYQGFRQLMALNTFASAATIPAGENQPAEVVATVARAYNFHASDVFLRELAIYKLVEMQSLATIQSPSQGDTQRFRDAVAAAIEASDEAINRRASDARNWSIRGDIYTALAALGVEGAADRATADYAEARKRDPQNPYYDLQAAILAATTNKPDEARAKIADALRLKSNYTDALMLLSQLDIASGNIKEAIRTTESLIAIEGNNPGRFYQLGVLYSADQNRTAAIDAFNRAIALNPQYANARYLLALEYLASGNQESALNELRIVRDLNADNASVADLISQIERGEVNADTIRNSGTEVTEPAPVASTDDVVTTNEAPDSNLVTPVNTVPATTTPAASE